MKTALLSLLAVASLTSCSNLERDAFKDRLKETAKLIAAAVAPIAIETTLASLRRELALLEARPIDADPVQQLADQGRIATLKTLIAQGEAKLASLQPSGK
jgi:hypothetical protein